MATEIIQKEKKHELLTMSFMRSKTKPTNITKEKPSLVDMTREEFKRKLEQHKSRSNKIIH